MKKLCLAMALMLAMVCLACAAFAEEGGYTFNYTVLDDGTASITGIAESGEGEMVIPETIDGYTVTKIGNYAFSYDLMTSVVIPDTVKEIGYGAFEESWELESVKLSANLESIGSYAFSGTAISEIALPESLKSMGDNAFYSTDLVSVEIPDGVESLGDGVFQDCESLKSVRLPAGIQKIPAYFLYYCSSISTFEIPDTVKTIGSSAFQYSGLRGIVIPENVETIEAYAFMGTGMEYAIVPASVTNLGTGGYYDDELGQVFDDETKLYITENSAAHAYAQQFEHEFVLTGSDRPEIYDVESTGRIYEAIGDTVTWTIRALGSDDLSYYFRLHRDGEVILSRWQDSPELSYTFEETGNYTLKTVVKNAEGVKSDYFWISSFNVIETMPDVPTVTDFKLDTAKSITTNTPITWSYYITGGCGSFGDGLDYSYNVRFTDTNGDVYEDEYGYVRYTYWGVDGGLFVKATYFPTEAGVYTITMVPTDDEGLEGKKLTVGKFTVKNSAFKLSKITHNMQYYEFVNGEYEDDDGNIVQETGREYFVRKGDSITWKFTPKNAKGDVVYTLRILNLEVDPTRVQKQIVSESPEITVDFDFDCFYPAWQVTAYDKGSGSYYTSEAEWFEWFEEDEAYFPYDWDIENAQGYYLTVGQADTWYACEPWEETDFQQRVDNGEFLFRYEFLLDDEVLYETDWSTDSRVTYAFEKTGDVEVYCYLKNVDGYIHRTSSWHYVEPTEETPAPEYDIQDFYGYPVSGGLEWYCSIWHNDEACDYSNCEHVTVRYSIYKDDQLVETGEWMPADRGFVTLPKGYGTYRAVAEFRDESGNIVATGSSDKCVVELPKVDHFGFSGGYEGSAYIGGTVWWYVFAEGGIDVSANEIQFTLLRDGEPVKTWDWQKMEHAEDYEFMSESGTVAYRSVNISQPGVYAVEVQIRDAKGTLSEKVRSGDVYTIPGAKSDLRVNALYCDWIALSLGSEESIHWTAVTSGGAGGNEYAFTILRDGEVYKEFAPQKGDSIAWKPDAEGTYTVKVVVTDSKGAAAQAALDRGCVVLDPEERTITSLTVSAGEIWPAVGDRIMLDKTVEPANPSVKTLAYASDNEDVAVVSKKGLIEIVGPGDAVITVSTMDGSELVCTLRVHASEYAVAVMPAALTTIRAEAFDASGIIGLDLSNADAVTFETGALTGSAVRTIRIPDAITLEEGALGENSVALYCGTDAQIAAAKAAGLEYVIVK